MRIHPVNPAEAVIAPFFDRSLTPEGEWTLAGPSTTRNLHVGRGYTSMVLWDAAEPGRPAFTWSWEGQLDLSGYDGLFLQAGFPSTVTMRFSAQVDGQWQLICASRGCDTHDDYIGSFQGRMIQGLRIECTPDTSTAGAFGTYYIGAHHSRRLEDWLTYEQPTVYPADWPEFIKPAAEWDELQPELNLFFDATELDALREKLGQPPYKDFADALRRQTHSFLEREPEREIRQYMLCGCKPYAYSARARDRGYPFWRPMEQCAFFGLLDRDPALIRMAARYMIAHCHFHHWSEGFVEHDFRGSATNWRSFYQTTAVLSMTAALDWIGGALTDHAKEVICHNLYFKGLAPIKFDFARYEYIYHMNQAVVFSPARIAALLAIGKYWPRISWELEQAQKDLDETSFRIIMDDGGYGEGPGYYSAVVFYMLGGYLLLARHQGISPETLIPPSLLKSADYYGTFVSTSVKAGRLPLSDGGTTTLAPDWMAMLAQVTGDARWNKMLVDRLNSDLEANINLPNNGVWLGTGVRTLIYGPSDLSRQEEIVPTFRIHQGSGHSTSRRDTPYGPVRVHLSGSSPTEGHSHADKGAVLLEAFGEMLLTDRGTPVYSDPAVALIKAARLHNVLTPVNASGDEMDQMNPCPAAVLPEGQGNEQMLHLHVDTTPAWGAPVVRMDRSLDSDDPLHLTITDYLELAQSLPVVLHLHSHYPITVHDGATVGHPSATLAANRSKLHVTWDWPGEIIHSDVELADGDYQPVYHLAVRAPAASHHRLVTRLAIEPLASSKGESQ